MISTIYFDIGGVVFDDFYSRSGSDFTQALKLPKKAIYKVWVETDHTDYAKNRMSDKKRWRIFTDELGLSKDKVQVCIYALYKQYKPITKTVDFIKRIRKTKKNIKLGILADQPMGVVKLLRKKYQDIIKLFDKSLVLFSAEVELSKRDKDLKIFKEAIKRAKTSANNILFVDNSLTNIRSAQTVGIQGFYFDIENKPISILLDKLEKAIE